MSMNDESSELFTSLIKSTKPLVSQLSMCDQEEYNAFIVGVGDSIVNLLTSETSTRNSLYQSALENLPFIIENFDDIFNNLINTTECADMSAFEVDTIKGYVRDTIKHVLEVIQ